ncbi:MAG TPA: SDR family oxidoreductase, partial [Acidimicrobiales bacterium]|nr:SDR family oxidoreductase [Acidimicrobiales bacterium]
QLQGNVAVVTGGGSGIGAALARRFAADGAKVAVVDLDAAKAEAVAADLDGAIAIGLDVTDGAAVAEAIARVERELGPIGVYCSNAGIAVGGGLGTDDDWARSWAVHGMAHVHAARAVLPGMVERKSGAFVVTASAAGLLAMMQSAVYTVTKHASVAVAEWLSIAYGGDGVSVHALCPQGVNTPMVQGGTGSGTSELQAAGGIIEPEQVADEVVAAVTSGTFLILPHPEVHRYEQGKVADRDRWLAGMRKVLAKVGTSS